MTSGRKSRALQAKCERVLPSMSDGLRTVAPHAGVANKLRTQKKIRTCRESLDFAARCNQNYWAFQVVKVDLGRDDAIGQEHVRVRGSADHKNDAAHWNAAVEQPHAVSVRSQETVHVAQYVFFVQLLYCNFFRDYMVVVLKFVRFLHQGLVSFGLSALNPSTLSTQTVSIGLRLS